MFLSFLTSDDGEVENAGNTNMRKFPRFPRLGVFYHAQNHRFKVDQDVKFSQ